LVSKLQIPQGVVRFYVRSEYDDMKKAVELRSIELFSGIGGLSLALEGVARPVAYCDIEASARAVLRDRMKRGELPEAPVCEDIKDLTVEWLLANGKSTEAKRVDAVVAGFPCVGFSLAGKREGFKNDQSALFFEMLRVIDAFRVKHVFLENVPGILGGGGMDVVVKELCEQRGFELGWCLMSAFEVGAPHRRTRWYCYGVRRARSVTAKLTALTVWKRWGQGPEERMALRREKNWGKRYKLLGNTVVPQAARRAYETVLNRWGDGVAEGEGWPDAGRVGPDLVVKRWEREKTRPMADAGLTLDPGAYRSGKPPNKQISTELIREKVHIPMWATPTSSSLGHTSNHLTGRTKRTLCTQVRFEVGTQGHLRKGWIRPEFVEWLMGYPEGWTAGA
jgi:hypothetical protein